MTLRHLRVFDCVCRNGSITKAAEELYIAQPAVSKTISELEAHYQITLFHRVNQRLILSEQGNLLWLKAKEILSSFSEFEDIAHSVENSPTLKMGATLTISKLYVPALVNKIKERFPNLQLSLYVNQATKMEDKISTGALDFALTEGVSTDQYLISIPIFEDRMVSACGYDYNAPDKMTLAELSHHPLLIRESGSASAEPLKNKLSDLGLRYHVFMESASNEALISAAIGNLGMIVLPEGLLRGHIDNKKLRVVNITDADFNRHYYLRYHKNRRFGKTQEAVLDYCLQFFKTK